MFNTPYSRDKKFYLTLLADPFREKVKEIAKNDSVVVLNTDYIVSSFHIHMAINKACYNIKMGKCKSKNLKLEITHCTTNETKLDSSLSLHSIDKNIDNNYFLIFINMDKNSIEESLQILGGSEISPVNYSKFVMKDRLMKAFQIKDEEIRSLENGLLAAVYNRVSTKELK